jgi:high-affinity Fe2+/Pb2+ permease
MEWPDLTETQKKQFLYGDLPAVGVIGAVLAAVFIYAAVKIGDIKIGFVLLGLLIAFGVVILGIFYLISWLNIRRSERRRWGRGF